MTISATPLFPPSLSASPVCRHFDRSLLCPRLLERDPQGVPTLPWLKRVDLSTASVTSRRLQSEHARPPAQPPSPSLPLPSRWRLKQQGQSRPLGQRGFQPLPRASSSPSAGLSPPREAAHAVRDEGLTAAQAPRMIASLSDSNR
eukprot:766092-Hanusia_phi.AAC.3